MLRKWFAAVCRLCQTGSGISLCQYLISSVFTDIDMSYMQFIQKPSSHPELCLRLLIPSAAVLHQAALGYFLRQNLLQFLFVPKYQDASRPENTFLDFTSVSGTGLSDADVFLYRPQQAGSKGHTHFWNMLLKHSLIMHWSLSVTLGNAS